MNKKKIIGEIVTILILIVSLIIIIINRVNEKNLKEYITVEDLYNLEDPIQEEAEGNISIKKFQYKYNIEYLYSYKIRGRIIKTHSYLPTSYTGVISPLDVGIVWGKYAKDEYVSKFKFQNLGDRFLRYYIKDNSLGEETADAENHISHNHLIYSNKKIKKQIKLIKKNDFVEIEGYLVKVTGKNMDISNIWKSSTTRTDKGDGACEIIYVTSIKWLTDNK